MWSAYARETEIGPTGGLQPDVNSDKPKGSVQINAGCFCMIHAEILIVACCPICTCNSFRRAKTDRSQI